MRIADLDIGGTSIKSGIRGGEWASELKEWDTCASQGGKCLVERVKMILHTYKEFDAIEEYWNEISDVGFRCRLT